MADSELSPAETDLAQNKGKGEVCEYRTASDFLLAKRVVKESWCENLPDYARRVSRQAVAVAESPDSAARDRLHAADFILGVSKHVAETLLAADPAEQQPQQVQATQVTVNVGSAALQRVKSKWIDPPEVQGGTPTGDQE